MSAWDRLAQIQDRADKATDGPWKIETHYGMSQSRRRQIVVPGWMTPIAVLGQENPYGDPDAVFIAHARTDVPRLVAAVQAFFGATREHRDRDRLGCECPACEGYRAACAALKEGDQV